MKGCHNCKHSEAIAKGEYADLDWEKVPCSTCNVMSGVGYAINHEDWRMTQEDSNAHDSCRQDEPDDAWLPLTVLRDLLIGFLKLNPKCRDVVAWRYLGMRYEDIALAQGVTTACAEKRHQKALELWPELGKLFPVKVKKRAKRKKALGANCRMRRERGTAS